MHCENPLIIFTYILLCGLFIAPAAQPHPPQKKIQ